MKKIAIFSFLFITSLILTLIIISLKVRSNNHNIYNELTKSLNINNDKKTYLIFIDPTCTPCHKLIRSISHKEYVNNNIVYININDDKLIETININSFLFLKKNIDPNNRININITPTIIVFNNNMSFIKEYKGVTDFNLISNENKF